MRKRTLSLLTVVLLLTLSLGTVFLYVSAARPSKRSGRPRFKIWITRRVVPIGESFDTWLFVTNPSRDMETQSAEQWERMPVHVVEVLSLKVFIVSMSNGETQSYVFPLEDPKDWQKISGRWNPFVYPGERSLVFFVGWLLSEKEDFWEAGPYEFIYILQVSFEGETFELVKTFMIMVTD